MSDKIFKGILPALVTPMSPGGEVDLDGLANHVEWVISEGVHGLVPCGTTGESATLSAEEQDQVIRRTVEVAAGRIPVLAGAGGNDTATVAGLAAAARRAGADGVLTVTPPYNKPSLPGLVAHYRAVAEASGLPVILYNVPGRTGQNVLPAQVLEIHEAVPTVVGLKEAAGSVAQMAELMAQRPSTFSVLSGDDDLALPELALGADGVISVAANEVPGPLSRLYHAVGAGDLDAARTLFSGLLPLLRGNFLETNPIPVKTALEILGRGPAYFRLPLVPMSPEPREALLGILRELQDHDLLEGSLTPDATL